MSRAKLIIENFFAYGFIEVLIKIVPWILIPIITILIPDPSDFAIFDMFNLIVAFGTPLAILGMYDAMFREYFEKEDQEYRYNVTTTAQRIVFTSSSIVCSILLLFNTNFSFVFFGTTTYGKVVIYASVSFFLSANINLIQAPTRIHNKRKIFILSGLMSSGSSSIISILLLYLGFSYFGLIYSQVITSTLLLLFFWILNKDFFLLGKFDKRIAKELFKIGLPLLPSFLIYWIYNSMDRIMISNMLGTTDLGVFAIGSRVSQISMFIYLAFSTGWQYFAFSTMKDEDQVKLNSKVFEYLGAISLLSFVTIYPFIKLIFSILFNGGYILGYKVAPYLYMSPLLLMLFQIVGNQFLVIKKSYWITISLSLGALLNIVLNLFLIKKIGIEGAAISTLTGYVVTLIVVCAITVRMDLLILSNRFKIISVLTCFYLLICRLFLFDEFLHQFLFSVILICVFVVLYKNELRTILKKMKTLKNG